LDALRLKDLRHCCCRPGRTGNLGCTVHFPSIFSDREPLTEFPAIKTFAVRQSRLATNNDAGSQTSFAGIDRTNSTRDRTSLLARSR